ncbi:MAG: ribosomal protein S18-alanine N-acetyltransferase [Acaryochloridaceae cyanobacterium SU_2_1]|nr:ribosomal protein S18-alanine N-acetyltransferase [Acaryochloridaceae cyanobacterium SU_2_1]NJM95201.1 ribosomal protein S18-alanine N-acetyltransferase [Acaryochloridaceae cyanobacterium CSU_5_19]
MSLWIRPLVAVDLAQAQALDQQGLGGWWSDRHYQQEIDRPSSLLLGLFGVPPQQGLRPDIPLARVDQASRPASLCLLGMVCLWLILDEAHITLLVVHPDYRGQGLGQALLGTVLQLARYRMAMRATLEVRASNQGAVNLYRKFGFQSLGCRPGYYQDGEDALILWLNGMQGIEFEQCLQRSQQQLHGRLSEQGWPALQVLV